MPRKKYNAIVYLRPFYEDLGKLDWFLKRFLSKWKMSVIARFEESKKADVSTLPELRKAIAYLKASDDVQVFLTVGWGIDGDKVILHPAGHVDPSEKLRKLLRGLNISYAQIQTTGWDIAGYVAEESDNLLDDDDWSDLPIPPEPTRTVINRIKRDIIVKLGVSHDGQVPFNQLKKEIRGARGQFVLEVAKNCVVWFDLSEGFVRAIRELEAETKVHVQEVHVDSLESKDRLYDCLPIANSPVALKGSLFEPYWLPSVLKLGEGPEGPRKKLKQGPNTGNEEWRRKERRSWRKFHRRIPNR